MIRAISTEVMFELAARFGFSEVMEDGAPRDVHWTPVQLASKHRDERVKRLSIASKMPFCSFYLSQVKYASDRRSRMASHGGALPYALEANGSTEEGVAKTIRLAPVDLSYQIDVWCASNAHAEMMGYVRAWVMWQDKPSVLEITEAGSEATVSLAMSPGDPVNNSGIEAMFEKGRRYRYTFPLGVEGYVADPPETFFTIHSLTVNVYEDLDGNNLFASEDVE